MNFIKRQWKILVSAAIVLPVAVFLTFSFGVRTADAAIALVQTYQNGYGYVQNYNVVMTTSVTTGDTLIMAVTTDSSVSGLTVSDNHSNSWILIATDGNSSQRKSYLYYAYSVTGGSETISVTNGGGGYTDSAVIVREYSGLSTSAPLDVSAHTNDGGNYQATHNTGTTASIGFTPELVVAVSGAPDGNEPGWSYPSGYSNGVHQKGSDNYTYEAMADYQASSVATQSATFGTTDNVVGQGIIATFNSSGSTPAPVGAPTAGFKVTAGTLLIRSGTLTIKQ